MHRKTKIKYKIFHKDSQRKYSHPSKPNQRTKNKEYNKQKDKFSLNSTNRYSTTSNRYLSMWRRLYLKKLTNLIAWTRVKKVLRWTLMSPGLFSSRISSRLRAT